jgi:hypothetical protein
MPIGNFALRPMLNTRRAIAAYVRKAMPTLPLRSAFADSGDARVALRVLGRPTAGRGVLHTANVRVGRPTPLVESPELLFAGSDP